MTSYNKRVFQMLVRVMVFRTDHVDKIKPRDGAAIYWLKNSKLKVYPARPMACTDTADQIAAVWPGF